MNYETADLCDAHGDGVCVVDAIFTEYGAKPVFHGDVCTVRVERDFLLVRQILDEPGADRVLVVDGGAYQGGALLGGQMAKRAVDNQWAGVIINGCIRDVAELATLPIGIRALKPSPARSAMEGVGERDVMVEFGGVKFASGAHVYADHDGIVVAAQALTLAP